MSLRPPFLIIRYGSLPEELGDGPSNEDGQRGCSGHGNRLLSVAPACGSCTISRRISCRWYGMGRQIVCYHDVYHLLECCLSWRDYDIPPTPCLAQAERAVGPFSCWCSQQLTALRIASAKPARAVARRLPTSIEISRGHGNNGTGNGHVMGLQFGPLGSSLTSFGGWPAAQKARRHPWAIRHPQTSIRALSEGAEGTFRPSVSGSVADTRAPASLSGRQPGHLPCRMLGDASRSVSCQALPDLPLM
jgi:hypothetical protein